MLTAMLYGLTNGRPVSDLRHPSDRAKLTHTIIDICYCPPNFGGKQRAPQMAKNWFQAYLWLGMPQMEKSDGYMCSQASGSSGVMFLLPVFTWCCSPKSDDVSTGGSGSGMPENCVVAAYITFISLLFSSHHQLITTSGLRPPYWIYKCRRCTTWLMSVRQKKLRTKITGISSLAGTEPEILLGVIYIHPPTCNIRYKTHLQ